MQRKTPRRLAFAGDAYRNVAVKGQYEQVKPETVGFFGGGRNLHGAKVNVYSMVVDFVF